MENLNKFTRKMSEEMWGLNVSFETIVHIPTLGVHLNRSFEDFLESIDDNIAASLSSQNENFKDVYAEIKMDKAGRFNEEHASNLSMLCADHEFLVQAQVNVMRNVKLDEQGNFVSASLGGFYQLEWFFAKNMIHAGELAIAFAERVKAKAIEDARGRVLK